MKPVTLLLFLTLALSLAPAGFGSVIVYNATLNGAMESTSPGSGAAVVTLDNVANTINVAVTFTGLTAGTTASHIHCCTAAPGAGTAGIATPLTGFPTGVTSGSYNQLFDLTLASTYNSAFVSANGGTATGAEAALLAGLAADKAYLNIHTTAFPAGEISGFLVATPEPGTWLLTGLGVAACALRRRLSNR